MTVMVVKKKKCKKLLPADIFLVNLSSKSLKSIKNSSQKNITAALDATIVNFTATLKVRNARTLLTLSVLNTYIMILLYLSVTASLDAALASSSSFLGLGICLWERKKSLGN